MNNMTTSNGSHLSDLQVRIGLFVTSPNTGVGGHSQHPSSRGCTGNFGNSPIKTVSIGEVRREIRRFVPQRNRHGKAIVNWRTKTIRSVQKISLLRCWAHL